MRLKSRRHPRGLPIERVALCLFVSVAGTWIIITFLVVLFHYKRGPTTTAESNQADVVSPQAIVENMLPIGFALADKPVRVGVVESFESPLLIFTCSRENYLRDTLSDILKYIPRDCSMGCPVIISQDEQNAAVLKVVQEFQDKFRELGLPVVHLLHPSGLRGGRNPYQALAAHYGWALGQVFDQGAASTHVGMYKATPQRVIILEEDLHIAPDFFSYFNAMAPLLDRDTSLFAVSAFNDNGYEAKVQDHRRVVRSDFFPGLGWMMTRNLWVNELASKWPEGYWDDWLRLPEQRQGRQVLRPEVSRTYHFGFEGGASQNQYGGRLVHILLNQVSVDWSKEDVSYLRTEAFDRQYWNLIHGARSASSVDDALRMCQTGNVQLEYSSTRQFQSYASELDLMDDEKAGIYRTAYKGVIETRPLGQHFVFLTPPMRELQKEFEHVI